MDGAYLLNLPSTKIGDRVDYDPRQTATKVNNLVHDEGHDARGEDVVLHPQVPGCPKALEGVELDIVPVDVVEDAEVALVRGGLVGKHDSGVPVGVVCKLDATLSIRRDFW